MTAPRVLSLCSGYGGLDLAVEEVFGAVTVAHAEVEQAACKVLEARWPGVPNIGNVKVAAWWHAHWWRDLFEIITAGYPCQPFSHAGRRKGEDDPRHLWPHIAQAIRGVRPRLVVLENVAGHRTLGLDTVLGDLAALGYDARWTSLRASDIGAPHGRERLFIVATDAADRGHPTGLRSGHAARQPEPPRGCVPTAHTRGEADGLGAGLRACEPACEWRGRPDDNRISAPAADARSGGRDGVEGIERDGRHPPVGGQTSGHAGNSPVSWGQYAAAIERWERVLGRVAPAPTEAGPRGGQRLSPRFVEWMMGLPAGWVTDVPDVSRNAQLKMLGNGVVPQQSIAALRHLIAVRDEVAAA